MSTSTDELITVWIVEDDEHYKISLNSALKKTPDIQCKRSFWDCEAVFKSFEKEVEGTAPDVILLDINLPGLSGIEAIGHLKAHAPETQIVMLTIMDDESTIYAAFCAGASGYLLKNASFEQITAAIRAASEGGMLMPPGVAERVLRFFTREQDTDNHGLTRRELEVLQNMADGYSEKEIAQRLFISENTVNTHKGNLYRKLHVSSGSEAVSKALRERLIR